MRRGIFLKQKSAISVSPCPNFSKFVSLLSFQPNRDDNCQNYSLVSAHSFQNYFVIFSTIFITFYKSELFLQNIAKSLYVVKIFHFNPQFISPFPTSRYGLTILPSGRTYLLLQNSCAHKAYHRR